jgi:hypothetical protein
MSFLVLTFVLAASAMVSMVLFPSYAQSSFTVLSASDYIDSVGFYHIVGEVKNDSEHNVRLAVVRAMLYDQQGSVAGRPFGYALNDVIRPGEKSPFHVIFSDSEQSGKVESYQLSVDATPLLSDIEPRLELKVGQGYLDSIGVYHLVGNVTNKGDATARSVEVDASFYDSNGRIIDTATGYTGPSDVTSGTSETFEVVSVSPNASAIVSSSASVESVQNPNSPEFPTLLAGVTAGLLGVAIVLTELKRKAKRDSQT